MKFELPKEPIDRYEIKFWRVNVSERYCYIDEVKIVYFVNAAYSEVVPNNGEGVRLVDEWMLYSNGTPEFRLVGWKFDEEWLNLNRNTFNTKENAIEYAIEKLTHCINHHTQIISELKEKVKELEGC